MYLIDSSIFLELLLDIVTLTEQKRVVKLPLE